jgi:asparagine synthetase B (glutamine-hydrolysing)
MKMILDVQFSPTVFDVQHPQKVYEMRRDAVFAAVFQDVNSFYAITDPMSNVPLFYRKEGELWRFSTSLSALTHPTDTLNTEGVKYLIGLGACKLKPILNEVGVVPMGCVVRFQGDEITTLYQYRFQPHAIPLNVSFQDLVVESKRLFKQALERTLKSDTVGLYLSGGIDSALIGLYLSRMGVQVHAYTSAPWGITSSEIEFAKVNVREIGATQHHIDILDSQTYTTALDKIGALFGLPHGTSTGIGVASMWLNTPFATESQVYFGQNSDTMTCSVPAQYLTYFTRWLPKLIRQRFRMPHNNLIENYLHFFSRGLVKEMPYGNHTLDEYNAINQLTLAGMLAAHSPSDGEVLSQAGLQKNIRMSNPYYDIDLIEFCMGVPFHHRINMKLQRNRPVVMEKRLFQAMAIEHLPASLVFRKKGFVVSLERDEFTKRLLETFPREVIGIAIKDSESRTSAEMLKRWCALVGVTF